MQSRTKVVVEIAVTDEQMDRLVDYHSTLLGGLHFYDPEVGVLPNHTQYSQHIHTLAGFRKGLEVMGLWDEVMDGTLRKRDKMQEARDEQVQGW